VEHRHFGGGKFGQKKKIQNPDGTRDAEVLASANITRTNATVARAAARWAGAVRRTKVQKSGQHERTHNNATTTVNGPAK